MNDLELVRVCARLKSHMDGFDKYRQDFIKVVYNRALRGEPLSDKQRAFVDVLAAELPETHADEVAALKAELSSALARLSVLEAELAALRKPETKPAPTRMHQTRAILERLGGLSV
ncbi:hypothetical protein [Ferrovibrio sp.]|uniref:hypothetical protein n=1 Tax=Ferrovibrio sp. TaxID=1917215 RepID=UPI0035B313FB